MSVASRRCGQPLTYGGHDVAGILDHVGGCEDVHDAALQLEEVARRSWRRRSSRRRYPRRPPTSTISGIGAKSKSTRAMWVPLRRYVRWIVTRGRSAARTSSRKRRSSQLCTPADSMTRSKSATPARPCRPSSTSRLRTTLGAVRRSLVALSRALPISRSDARPSSSTTVRVPEVHGRPSTRIRSRRPMSGDDATAPSVMRSRIERGTRNCNGPSSNPSRPCNAAAARADTSAAGRGRQDPPSGVLDKSGSRRRNTAIGVRRRRAHRHGRAGRCPRV